MKRVITLIVAVSMLLMACGGTSTDTSKNVAIDTQQDASKVESHSLAIGHNQEFMNFTTHNGGDNGFIWYAANCYETLVYSSSDGIKPGLATSWEEKDNALILHLREDVTFSDGEKFNAEAVKINIENLQAIQGQAVSFIEILNQLKNITIIDEYTIKLDFDHYSHVYLRDLTSLYPFGMMSPRAYDNGEYSKEVYSTRTLGTGAYKITDFESGKFYKFERNTSYWGDKGNYSDVTIKIIPDQESMALALRTGEIYMIFGSYQVNNSMFDEFLNAEGFTAKESTSINKSHYLALNSTRAPFNDKNVKYALAHGIDKASIYSNILQSRGKLASTHLNPELEYCNVPVEERQYDVDKAKSLLEESGWIMDDTIGYRTKGGEKLSVNLTYINGSSAYQDIAIALKSQLKEIGMDVTIEGLDMMSWWGKVMSGDFDVSFNATIGVPYDPYVELKSMISLNTHAVGMAGTEEKEIIDGKIAEIFKTNDQEVLQDIFTVIITKLNESGNDVPMFHEKEPVIFSTGKISDVIFTDTVTFLKFDNALIKK